MKIPLGKCHNHPLTFRNFADNSITCRACGRTWEVGETPPMCEPKETVTAEEVKPQAAPETDDPRRDCPWKCRTDAKACLCRDKAASGLIEAVEGLEIELELVEKEVNAGHFFESQVGFSERELARHCANEKRAERLYNALQFLRHHQAQQTAAPATNWFENKIGEVATNIAARPAWMKEVETSNGSCGVTEGPTKQPAAPASGCSRGLCLCRSVN